MNDKNKNEVIKWSTRITSLFLSTVTAVTMAGCKLNKNKNNNENTITTTSISMESENTSPISESLPDIDTVEITKLEAEQRRKIQDEKEYKKLKPELDNAIKKYPSEVQKELKELFDTVYTNYDDIYNLLKFSKIPKKEELINNLLINPLKNNIKTIKFTNTGSSSYFDYDKKEICIAKENEKVRKNVLFEEIIHSTQMNVINKLDSTTAEYCNWGEGEANAWAYMLTYPTIENESDVLFYPEKGNEDKMYTFFGTGNSFYTLATRYYMQLLTLVGYDAVEEFKKNPDSSKIVEILSSKYGIDGKTYYDNMQKVTESAMNYEDSKNIDLLVRNEEIYFECLEKELSCANSNDEVLELFNYSRYYNSQYAGLYQIYKGGRYVSEKYLSAKENYLKNLFLKVEDTGALNGLASDSDERFKIFYAIMNPEVDIHNEGKQPVSLATSKITYDGTHVGISNSKSSVNINTETRIITPASKNTIGYNIFSTQSEQKVR